VLVAVCGPLVRFRAPQSQGCQHVAAVLRRGHVESSTDRPGSFTPGKKNRRRIVNDCFNSGGTSPECAFITRPTPTSFPTAVTLSPLNSQTLLTEGLDFDASYSTVAGPGKLTARLYANYLERFVNPQLGTSGNLAGYAVSQTAVYPHIRATLALDYRLGSFDIFAAEQFIGPMNLNPPIPNDIHVNPDVASVWFTNATLDYATPFEKADAHVFLTVSNLFDKQFPELVDRRNRVLVELPIVDVAKLYCVIEVRRYLIVLLSHNVPGSIVDKYRSLSFLNFLDVLDIEWCVTVLQCEITNVDKVHGIRRSIEAHHERIHDRIVFKLDHFEIDIVLRFENIVERNVVEVKLIIVLRILNLDVVHQHVRFHGFVIDGVLQLMYCKISLFDVDLSFSKIHRTRRGILCLERYHVK